ncbi:site-specific integrase [Staphylococcus lentus]|uniref:tyrosine-type recombinase/integrase n=1 Tax=Mammaliicoccus lentus TaxID=42858 RepID=UPI0018832D71|nr:site-specific integrase [Mammaliicoccus lentus]MBF0842346.1 site-specific integrase [Mammaliicoccus lentus]
MHIMKTKDGKYKVTIEAPRDPITGKRKQITRRHEKKGVAIEKATKEYNLRMQSLGMYGTDSTASPTFRQVAEEWHSFYSKRKKLTTVVGRRHALNVLYRYFDNIEIRNIRHKMIQNMMDDLSLNKCYSIPYCQSVKGALNMIMKYAINQGLIIHNPALNVSYTKPPITIDSLEREEVNEKIIPTHVLKAIFDITDKKRHYYKNLHEYFKIMYYTGCRSGEIAALKSTDVDLKNKTISITKTLFNEYDRVGDYILLPPKDNEKRIISVNDTVIEIVKKLKAENKEKAEIYEGIYTDEDFLFSNSEGHPYFTSHVCKKFKRAIIDSNLKVNGLTPHSLRHTHTTRLIEAGVPVNVIQERLGHASINTTLGIYAHVTREMKQLTTQQLDEHLKLIDKLDLEIDKD